MITPQEAKKIIFNQWQSFLEDNIDYGGISEAYKMAMKALEQQSCETIEEIPKDYKYDTETEDFLVYRHKYTGHEIHIEKPVPRYKLEQQPCEDVISREEAIKEFQVYREYSSNMSNVDWVDRIETVLTYLPSVIPKPKIGYWIDTGSGQECSECGEIQYGYDNFRCFCANCGAKMEEEKDDNTRESNRTT